MPVQRIGASNIITTNGGAPGAITVNAGTQTGDLLLFFHYGRATGGNETVTPPGGTGWTQIFNSVTANNGHVAVFWRIRQAGDGTYTFTVGNYTSGTSGETIIQWIETYRGHNTSAPIASFTAALSTWASSLTLGSITAPSTATVTPGSMVVVFAGRFENVTGQTTLSGDSLTWAQGTRGDTTLGLDAGAVTQTGLNNTGSNQTVTAKSITTTGTAQAGAGRMLIIQTQVNTQLDPGVGAVSAAGLSPTVTVTDNRTETAGLGAVSVTGFAAVLDSSLNIGLGEVVATGYAPDVEIQQAGITVSTQTGSATLAGNAPSVNVTIQTETGNASVSGNSPSLVFTVTAGTGEIVSNGFLPALWVGVGTGSAQVAATGYEPSVAISLVAATETGSATITGFQPSVIQTIVIQTQKGEAGIIGYEPTIQGPSFEVVKRGGSSVIYQTDMPVIDRIRMEDDEIVGLIKMFIKCQ